jgi:hypothetical protein
LSPDSWHPRLMVLRARWKRVSGRVVSRRALLRHFCERVRTDPQGARGIPAQRKTTRGTKEKYIDREHGGTASRPKLETRQRGPRAPARVRVSGDTVDADRRSEQPSRECSHSCHCRFVRSACSCMMKGQDGDRQRDGTGRPLIVDFDGDEALFVRRSMQTQHGPPSPRPPALKPIPAVRWKFYFSPRYILSPPPSPPTHCCQLFLII